VFGTFPDEKITHDNTLKQWYIDKDKRALVRQKQLEEEGRDNKTSI